MIDRNPRASWEHAAADVAAFAHGKRPAPCPSAPHSAPQRRAARALALCAAVAVSLAATTTATATGLPETPDEYLARMDLDGDGRISLAEFRDYMSRGFRARDLDGNGILEGDELPVPGARRLHLTDHLQQLADAFSRQDRNGDGWLDRAELAAPPR